MHERRPGRKGLFSMSVKDIVMNFKYFLYQNPLNIYHKQIMEEA